MQKFILAISVMVCLFSSFRFLEEWQLSKDANGVQVYTRRVAGSSIKEFKGVMRAYASVAEAVSMIKDANSHSSWMHNTSGSYVVKKISENDIYTYSVNEAPWPVDNRDNVVHMVFRNEKNSVTVDMTAEPDFIPTKSSTVRVRKLKGYWKVEDIGSGKVEITQQVLADPGGSLPAWLVNSAVVDNPYYTLLNMKKLLETN